MGTSEPKVALEGVPDQVRVNGKMRRLTLKERLFVYHYLASNGDATAAAGKAGYSDPNAHGYYIWRRPHVRAAIEAKVDTLITGREVLERLADHARIDITWLDQCYEVVPIPGHDEGYRRLNLKKVRKMGLGVLIKRIKPTRFGDEVELHDARAALELLGKHHKLFTERVEFAEDLDLETLSDEQLAELAKRAKK